MNTDGNIDAIDRHLADCEEQDDAWQDLQDQLEAARADAKEAEAYADELEKAMKKDWNDGTIHGWNGGDCPVHPETVVNTWRDGGAKDEKLAGCCHWGRDFGGDIIAFRVVKEYVEPRVIWVNEYMDGFHLAFNTEDEAKECAGPKAIRIAVKHVEAIADAKGCKE